MEKWLIQALEHKMYRMSQVHNVALESKDAIKDCCSLVLSKSIRIQLEGSPTSQRWDNLNIKKEKQ